MITFWGFPLSFNSRKVHWMLEELAVPYRLEVVDLVGGAHMQPAFREVNPLRRVPVLDDDGLRLIESNAIAWYLAERHGAERFGTPTLAERARAQMWLMLEANHVRPALQAPWRMKWISPIIKEPHDPAQLPGLVETAKVWLGSAEEMMGKGPWLAGDRFSVADICVAPVVECAPQLGIPLAPYPKLAAWFGRVRERPAFASTAPPSLGW